MLGLGLVGFQKPKAETYLTEARRQLFGETQTLIYNDHFAEADSVFSQWITNHPNDPTGYILRAGGLMAKMAAAEENLHEQLFKSYLDSGRVLTESSLESHSGPDAAWLYLLRGHAIAYRSIWESRFGSKLAAIRTGLRTNDPYEAALKADSTLIDSYMGLGSYHYWKSVKAGLLKWLLIFRNEKEKGIAELRRAAQESLVHRDAARVGLVWVWLEEKQYDSAIVYAQELAGRYPDGLTFRWPIAIARMRQEEHHLAAEQYRIIRNRLKAEPGNYFNMIQCDYSLAQCYQELQMEDELEKVAATYVVYRDKIPESVAERLKDKIKLLEALTSAR